MSFHNVKLLYDCVSVLGDSVEPLSLDELIFEVTNEGFKNKRAYTDDEILETIDGLVDGGFVDVTESNKYCWNK